MVENIQRTWNTPCKVTHKSFGIYNIYFETALPYQNIEWKKYLHCIAIISKTMKQKDIFLKYLFRVQYIMPYILIQINESIAKLVTLMVESHLTKIMEFKCNTRIILW
jgi:hypothetical protein